ncbi:putative reverse transcriptase domain-containing protein [Tanacetum coccineum]
MPLRKAPRTKTTPSTTTTTTTPMTDAHLKALIDQGVADAVAERDATRSRNGEDTHDSGTDVTRTEGVARECTYPDFMKFQPLNFKGTEGVFEPKKKMTDKYCPRGEIKKLEVEMWNLKVKESDKIKKYVGGLPDMIHGSVMASKPKTMQEAIKMATELMDKKISTFVERQTENKRKLDNNNQAQQQPPKKQGVAITYTAASSERMEYAGTLLLCNNCKFHHNGQCTIKYANCKRVGHLTRDCRSPAATNNQRNPTFYECRNQGHYKSDCLELKNQGHGNQAGDWSTETRESQTRRCRRYNQEGYTKGEVGDKVMLKVLTKVGAIAYKLPNLELPQELSRVHNTFHVSNLKKCYVDEPLAVLLDGLHIDDKLHFVKEQVEIMDRKVKRLK